MKKLAIALAGLGAPAYAHHGNDVAHSLSHAGPILGAALVLGIAALAYLKSRKS